MQKGRSYVSHDEEEFEKPVKQMYIWNDLDVQKYIPEDKRSFVAAEIESLRSISHRLSHHEVEADLRNLASVAYSREITAIKKARDEELIAAQKEKEVVEKRMREMEDRLSNFAAAASAPSKAAEEKVNWESLAEEHPSLATPIALCKLAEKLNIHPDDQLEGRPIYSPDSAKKLYQEASRKLGREYVLKNIHNNDVGSSSLMRAHAYN